MLEALHEVEHELGRQPTSRDLTRPPAGYPNTAVIKRKLGSWGAACRELGWRAQPRVRASDQQMLDALEVAAVQLGVGFSHEQYKAVASSRGWPSANAITARLATGTTRARLRACPRSDPSSATGAPSSSPARYAAPLGGSDARRRPPIGTSSRPAWTGHTAPQ